jgi:hypothetical protein
VLLDVAEPTPHDGNATAHTARDPNHGVLLDVAEPTPHDGNATAHTTRDPNHGVPFGCSRAYTT